MDVLPAELVRKILESLDQDDLRLAAAVSRTFYALAWRAGLVIHRKILWDQGKNCSAKLTTLSNVVQHARSKSLRLSLAFRLRSNGRDNSPSNDLISETTSADVLSSIPSALPVLVALSVCVTGPIIPALAAVLDHPAPNLHSLSLSVVPPVRLGTPAIRADVFRGVAPQLRHLALYDISVKQDHVSAFAHVGSLTLHYTATFPDIIFAMQFPALRTLSLALFRASPAAPPILLDLRGVGLEKLTITESDPPMLLPAVLRSKDLVNVPVFEYSGASAPWTEPRWDSPNDDGRLSVRLTGYAVSDTDVSILVVPEHRRGYHQYDVYNWNPDWPFPLTDLPRLAERLAYLRMDNVYLIGLLDFKDRAFCALREIQLDFCAKAAYSSMVWPPDWIDAFSGCTFSFDKTDGSAPTFEKESYRYLECAALDTIRLFAVDQEIRVASEEVAFLGRALRRKQGRAALELHGTQLSEPVAQGLLEETFSAVRQYEFAARDGPVGRDSGLWDTR